MIETRLIIEKNIMGSFYFFKRYIYEYLDFLEGCKFLNKKYSFSIFLEK